MAQTGKATRWATGAPPLQGGRSNADAGRTGRHPGSPLAEASVAGDRLFTYDAFAGIIQTASQHQYTFRRFDRPPEGRAEKLVYLRHDVDISPSVALRLGRIEKAASVQANFFFQINAETYNAFAPETVRIIEELRDFGHCVGLHMDASLIKPDEHSISSTLEWFRRCITHVDSVVSFHRPANCVLLREYRGFLNAYSAPFFSPDRYLSDSRRDPSFYPKLQACLAEGRTPLQLVLHPIWWYPEPDVAVLHRKLRERRLLQLDRYLKENFARVFGGLIEDVVPPSAP
jgi:hypothetical protein